MGRFVPYGAIHLLLTLELGNLFRWNSSDSRDPAVRYREILLTVTGQLALLR